MRTDEVWTMMNVIWYTSTLRLDLDMYDVHFCLPLSFFWPRHVTGDHTSTQGRDFVAKGNDDHSSDVMEISFSFGAPTLEILETTA